MSGQRPFAPNRDGWQVRDDGTARFTDSKGNEFLIDAADLGVIGPHHWRAHKDKRAFCATTEVCSRGKRKHVSMHRLLLDPPAGVPVDHVNGNGLDNCRANIRITTTSDNNHNRRNFNPSLKSSKFLGVHWSKQDGAWRVQFKKDRREFYVGLFKSEIEAAVARDQAVAKVFGEFACLNFPKERGR